MEKLCYIRKIQYPSSIPSSELLIRATTWVNIESTLLRSHKERFYIYIHTHIYEYKLNYIYEYKLNYIYIWIHLYETVEKTKLWGNSNSRITCEWTEYFLEWMEMGFFITTVVMITWLYNFSKLISNCTLKVGEQH